MKKLTFAKNVIVNLQIITNTHCVMKATQITFNCCWCGQSKTDHKYFDKEYWCDDINYLGKNFKIITKKQKSRRISIGVSLKKK